MKRYQKPIVAFVMFLVIQIFASIIIAIPALVIGVVGAAKAGEKIDPNTIESVMPGWLLAVVLCVSSIITIFFMQKRMKMLELKKSFNKPNMSLGKGIYLVFAAFVGIYATNIISEYMDLPNLIEAQLGDMASTFLGVLAIAFLGPLAEEVTFRGAIQRHLHITGQNPWRAILIASILFGVMHMNPAQIPFAAIIGFIMGIFYWKTQSLVLPVIIHVLNNGIACLLMNIAPEDSSLIELLGGPAIALSIAAAGFVFCGYVLYNYSKEPGVEIETIPVAGAPALKVETATEENKTE